MLRHVGIHSNVLFRGLLRFVAECLIETIAPCSTYSPPALIDMIVPPKSWDAVINLGSVQQILLAWRSKRVFEPCLITTLLDTIEQRAARYVVKTDFQHS